MKNKKVLHFSSTSLQQLRAVFAKIEESYLENATVKLHAAFDYREQSISSTRKLVLLKRESFGMTQADLAEQVGLTQSRLSKFETGTGDIGFDNFLKLMKVLTISFRSDVITMKESVKMSVHDLFREVRIAKKLKQSDVSQASGVGSSMLSWFEGGGRISVSSLEKLMSCLDIIIL